MHFQIRVYTTTAGGECTPGLTIYSAQINEVRLNLPVPLRRIPR